MLCAWGLSLPIMQTIVSLRFGAFALFGAWGNLAPGLDIIQAEAQQAEAQQSHGSESETKVDVMWAVTDKKP